MTFMPLPFESQWDFLLVINSNQGRISHRLRDMAIYSCKHSIHNCGQTAADGHMVTTGSL